MATSIQRIQSRVWHTKKSFR